MAELFSTAFLIAFAIVPECWYNTVAAAGSAVIVSTKYVSYSKPLKKPATFWLFFKLILLRSTPDCPLILLANNIFSLLSLGIYIDF